MRNNAYGSNNPYGSSKRTNYKSGSYIYTSTTDTQVDPDNWPDIDTLEPCIWTQAPLPVVNVSIWPALYLFFTNLGLSILAASFFAKFTGKWIYEKYKQSKEGANAVAPSPTAVAVKVEPVEMTEYGDVKIKRKNTADKTEAEAEATEEPAAEEAAAEKAVETPAPAEASA